MDHFLLSVSKFGLLVKVLRGCWTVLSFSATGGGSGLATEGREMKLMSFLASLESIRAKDNHLVENRGRV